MNAVIKKQTAMKNPYTAKNFDQFVGSSKEYQSQKHLSDSKIDPKAGKMETPIENMKVNHGAMNAAKASVKYDPKAVSFKEFTDERRNEKLQSYSKKGMHDGSYSHKGEDPGFEKLPSYAKPSKSFDIDVTKYKPRKAKG